MSTPLDTKGGKVGPFDGSDPAAGGSEEATTVGSLDAQFSSSHVNAFFGEQRSVSSTTDLSFDSGVTGF